VRERCPEGGEITTRSLLSSPAPSVWRWATSAAGVNAELRPFFRMTVPHAFRSGGLDDVALGERLGRCWILLFGVVPVDYDDLTIVRLEPERGFLEQSQMISQQRWEHERTLEPTEGGCVVTDRIAFVPRLRLPPAVFRALFAAVFRHRHRRLRHRFGGRDLGQRVS
jgi:ligand-binding SRPBCC domain-containing protein